MSKREIVRTIGAAAAAVVMAAPAAYGQAARGERATTGSRGAHGFAIAATKIEARKIIEAAPLESITPVKNAPFFAEAITEFTQTLGDGNRIERRYASSIARDSRGRTRRDEEIAMVGPLAAANPGPPPRLVTIVDPDAGLTYTLDESLRVAFKNGFGNKFVHVTQMGGTFVHDAHIAKGATAGVQVPEAAVLAAVPGLQATIVSDDTPSKLVSERLGMRSIEGVQAEGTRTTTTIAAGAIGNLMPIEIVSERWFSPELQMPVLVIRRDPRAGETVYRLVGIVRAEPSDDLFTIPPGYEVREGGLGGILMLKGLEEGPQSPKGRTAPKK